MLSLARADIGCMSNFTDNAFAAFAATEDRIAREWAAALALAADTLDCEVSEIFEDSGLTLPDPEVL